MWHGVTEYIAFVAFVGMILHGLVRSYATASIATAVASAVGNIIHETWVANFQVKPGWVLPLFIMGFVLALPFSFLVGVPHLLWRTNRRQAVADTNPKASRGSGRID